jgi:hypothetical protein
MNDLIWLDLIEQVTIQKMYVISSIFKFNSIIITLNTSQKSSLKWRYNTGDDHS